MRQELIARGDPRDFTRLAEPRRMRVIDAERAAELRRANIRLSELSNTVP
ncbi:hypothetical protein [Bradyrhizobium sp. URHC0002]